MYKLYKYEICATFECSSLLNTTLASVMQNSSHKDLGHSPQLGKMDIRSHLAAGCFERCPVEWSMSGHSLTADIFVYVDVARLTILHIHI